MTLTCLLFPVVFSSFNEYIFLEQRIKMWSFRLPTQLMASKFILKSQQMDLGVIMDNLEMVPAERLIMLPAIIFQTWGNLLK